MPQLQQSQKRNFFLENQVMMKVYITLVSLEKVQLVQYAWQMCSLNLFLWFKSYGQEFHV